MTSTAFALIGFIAWTLALLVLMETIRTCLVVAGKVPANRFTPDNSNLSPFMQRLARAHANCIEGLPLFLAAILLSASASRVASVIERLARFYRSLVHLLSCLSVDGLRALAPTRAPPRMRSAPHLIPPLAASLEQDHLRSCSAEHR